MQNVQCIEVNFYGFFPFQCWENIRWATNLQVDSTRLLHSVCNCYFSTVPKNVSGPGHSVHLKSFQTRESQGKALIFQGLNV